MKYFATRDVFFTSLAAKYAICIMSSRKRKNSTNPEITRNPSKRARLLSTLWDSQDEKVGNSASSQGYTSSLEFQIKAIIGERPTEYLIDWADNPITGETFTPDWVSENSLFYFLDYITSLDALLRLELMHNGISNPRQM